MSELSEREAFDAMTLFIDQWYDRAGNDLATLMGDLTLMEDGEPLDPAAYQDWLRVVEAVRAGAKPRSYDFVSKSPGLADGPA